MGDAGFFKVIIKKRRKKKKGNLLIDLRVNIKWFN